MAVHSASGSDWFDRVILATHSDQALALAGDASAAERAPPWGHRLPTYETVLHTDTAVMPPQRAAWPLELRARASTAQEDAACLHYWINQLRPCRFAQDVIVT